MKLIVGLGNPGIEYENTRHNIGFMLIDYFAKINNIKTSKMKFNGIYCDFVFNNEKIILLKPQSYMNLSGEVIIKFVKYFNISLEDILIISDDLDLNVGTYKLKASGSSGGHNGLKNIELNLNTKNYKRLKIGISNCKSQDTKDYVLGKISPDDLEKILSNFDVLSQILYDFPSLTFDSLMNKYNKKWKNNE